MGRAKTGRTTQRVVRLSEQEDAAVNAQATELGLTPAAFLRLAALRKLPRRRGILEPETAREIWQQVSGMARNVNQLTKYAHAGKFKDGELAALGGAVQALVKWVMEATARVGPRELAATVNVSERVADERC